MERNLEMKSQSVSTEYEQYSLRVEDINIIATPRFA